MSQWAEMHAELTNKIRWAITTTAMRTGRHIPYQEGKDWASSLATPIVEEWRALDAGKETSSSSDSLSETPKTTRQKKVSKAWLLANT